MMLPNLLCYLRDFGFKAQKMEMNQPNRIKSFGNTYIHSITEDH